MLAQGGCYVRGQQMLLALHQVGQARQRAPEVFQACGDFRCGGGL
jgi:hypothetical protein